MSIEDQLENYAKKVEEAGGTFQFLDYGQALVVKFGDDAIWACQQFRPERDGHTGYKLIEESLLDDWIKEHSEEL